MPEKPQNNPCLVKKTNLQSSGVSPCEAWGPPSTVPAPPAHCCPARSVCQAGEGAPPEPQGRPRCAPPGAAPPPRTGSPGTAALPAVLERPSVLFPCPSCTGQRQGVLFHELLKRLCYYTVPWDECKGLLPNELQSPVVTFINNTWLSSGSLIMSTKELKI